MVAQAVADARRNAELNGIHNATFIQGDLNKINDNFGDDFPHPDIVISGHTFSPFFNLYRSQFMLFKSPILLS